MMTTGSTTPSEAVPAQTVPVGSIVLIVLGVVPYAMVMAGMSDLHDVDGISRGLAGVYAVIGIAILWIMLAILLGLGAAKGRMPSWAGIAAPVLHPVSLVAVGATVDLLSSTSKRRFQHSSPTVGTSSPGARASSCDRPKPNARSSRDWAPLWPQSTWSWPRFEPRPIPMLHGEH